MQHSFLFWLINKWIAVKYFPFNELAQSITTLHRALKCAENGTFFERDSLEKTLPCASYRRLTSEVVTCDRCQVTVCYSLWFIKSLSHYTSRVCGIFFHSRSCVHDVADHSPPAPRAHVRRVTYSFRSNLRPTLATATLTDAAPAAPMPTLPAVVARAALHAVRRCERALLRETLAWCSSSLRRAVPTYQCR